jgi:hypothetical protein
MLPIETVVIPSFRNGDVISRAAGIQPAANVWIDRPTTAARRTQKMPPTSVCGESARKPVSQKISRYYYWTALYKAARNSGKTTERLSGQSKTPVDAMQHAVAEPAVQMNGGDAGRDQRP